MRKRVADPWLKTLRAANPKAGDRIEYDAFNPVAAASGLQRLQQSEMSSERAAENVAFGSVSPGRSCIGPVNCWQ
jgi:hypothetical protein